MHACFTALLALTLAPTAADSPFAFQETSSTGLTLTDGGKPVFVYNFGPILAPGFPEEMKRSCYIHPLYSPAGVLLSDDFNQDHPHHRGICWMWPEVTYNGKKGDIWMVKNFKQQFVAWKARETRADQARLAVENGWFDGEKKFVREDVDVIVHAVKGTQRALDFTLTFTALDQPVQVAGTSEGKKGFGGFCLRFRQRDGGEAKTVIESDKGLEKKDAVAAPRRWAQVSGEFDGKTAGGRIEDDPSNPNFPNNGWLLRHKFGFLNVSYPGLQPITLEPGKPQTLKYRVLVFDGQP